MTEVRLGLLRAAGMDVALPLEALREVVPHPEALVALPVRAAGLRGAMPLRRTVLPVVDLGAVVHAEQPAATSHPGPGSETGEQPGAEPGAETGAEPARVVVVVAYGGRLVGVLVDEVRGVAGVEREALQAVAADGTQLLVSHLAQVGDDATCTSVLDPEALVRLPGVPTVEERRPAVAGTDSVGEGRRPPLTVVRCGARLLALAIADVRTTVPLAAVTPSVLTGGHCLGTTVHDGRELPVLDPLSLLGLEPLDRDAVAAGVVVPSAGGGEVVLAVTRLELLERSPGPTMPVPPQAARRSDLLDGVQEIGDETCLVLRGEGLRTDPDVQAYAALGVEAGDAAAQGADGAGTTGPTCLTYEVGGAVVATPLAQVVEILPSPTGLTSTRVPDVSGLVVHRGHTVTVVDLGPALGRAGHGRADGAVGDETSGCLLLVEVDGRHVGFAVGRLHDIRPRTWADPEAPVRPAGTALGRHLETAPLVRVAGVDRLLPQLDLHEVARTLLDRDRDRDAGPGTRSDQALALSGAVA